MKYIRTKDGQVINLTGWQYDKHCKCYFNEKYRLQDMVYQNLIYKDEIIKRADTIEELCDEFVLITKYSELPILFEEHKSSKSSKFDMFKTSWEISTHNPKETNGSYYGAIWTDKGLIFVAKLNDKGEWVIKNSIPSEFEALKIILNKRVDVNDLLGYVDLKSYNEYVIACDDTKERVLTENEYNLVIEMYNKYKSRR